MRGGVDVNILCLAWSRLSMKEIAVVEVFPSCETAGFFLLRSCYTKHYQGAWIFKNLHQTSLCFLVGVPWQREAVSSWLQKGFSWLCNGESLDPFLAFVLYSLKNGTMFKSFDEFLCWRLPRVPRYEVAVAGWLQMVSCSCKSSFPSQALTHLQPDERNMVLAMEELNLSWLSCKQVIGLLLPCRAVCRALFSFKVCVCVSACSPIVVSIVFLVPVLCKDFCF